MSVETLHRKPQLSRSRTKIANWQLVAKIGQFCANFVECITIDPDKIRI